MRPQDKKGPIHQSHEKISFYVIVNLSFKKLSFTRISENHVAEIKIRYEHLCQGKEPKYKRSSDAGFIIQII